MFGRVFLRLLLKSLTTVWATMVGQIVLRCSAQVREGCQAGDVWAVLLADVPEGSQAGDVRRGVLAMLCFCF